MLYKLSDGCTIDDVLKAVCRDRDVYALEQTDNQYHLVHTSEWQRDKHTLGKYRPVEPLKSLVFRPCESLGAVMGRPSMTAIPERVVIGVKNCDLSALRIHDHVFLNTEPVDPYYKQAREKTILVTADCTDCLDVCFCTAVGEQPYPKEGFDINISQTPEGCVIESGSERGDRALEAAKNCLKDVDDVLLNAREKAREVLYERVSEQAAAKGLESGMDFKKAISGSVESDLWEDLAKDCVECGACNFICCTCHCFLLADGMSKDKVPTRLKLWDSCLFKNFARVAGGANPRSHRAERLLNRFDKKFNYFPATLDTYACDGCGRCVEACTGKIDIRDVLKRAVNESTG